MHINLELLSNAGIPPTITVGAPTTQGAGVAGMQGIGVKTPRAAAVAAITTGFAMEEHIPKGRIFSMGTWSMIVAAGTCVSTRFTGRTTMLLGAAPKLHFNIAPIQT